MVCVWGRPGPQKQIDHVQGQELEVVPIFLEKIVPILYGWRPRDCEIVSYLL